VSCLTSADITNIEEAPVVTDAELLLGRWRGLAPLKGKSVVVPEEIDPAFSPCRDEKVASVELDGEAVLYSDRSGELCILDPFATTLWWWFDGSTSVRDLADELATTYAEDRSVIERDLLDLVKHLAATGMLTGRPDAPSIRARAQRLAVDEAKSP
jgi:hypothetical protein